AKPAVQTLPVLPLRNLVLFPGVVLPVDVGRAGSLKLVDDVVKRQPSRVMIATQKDPQVEEPSPDELHTIGVEAEVLKVVKLSDTRVTVVIRGLERRRLGVFSQVAPYLMADVHPIEETNATSPEADGLAMAVRDTCKRVIAMSPDIPDETGQILDAIREPSRLADIASANLEQSTDERMALLAELDVPKRLAKVLESLQHRVQVFEVKEKIDTQVREEFSRHQREAVLRQKLKAIQEELGEFDDGEDVSEFDEKIKAAGMTDEAEKVARKQLERLKSMPSASAEYTVTRTYLEWLVELPWSKRTEDRLDLGEARAILDADHYDLQKVKRRILEYLAVRKLAPQKKGPILCLAGPPGVGKTSLGKSIARALGREFVRISLGGVRDEAEIRGHRRTYIGALPGRIVQGMKRAGTHNPIFMLDEIDKIGADFRGDPAAALLEVLDPEQNNSFSDHYLEVTYDLSEVIFIATANDLSPIPPALRDRMEILEIPGYTIREKHAIATKYLVPKQVAEHGLTSEHVAITDAALDEIIEHYTREAGVRNLERELANVIRGIAVKVASGETFSPRIGPVEIEELLGPAKIYSEIAERVEQAGVATGLAWTPTGGDILFIEISRMSGKGQLVLTGQLGSVMKESAQAALSYVRAHAAELGIPVDFLEKSDLHMHVPAGAVPKDGPSAGNAILAAVVSLLTGRRVRGDVAMTGEITLRGNVLPVGGIKEKLLAAHRAGIKRVIIPERNAKDLVELPDEVKQTMEIVLVKKVSETIAAALETEIAVPVLPPTLDAVEPQISA
ncbi:MAG: ATP-dependent protease La, partial [bacterium]|nr:ATP-dependent protease La [bacterium]